MTTNHVEIERKYEVATGVALPDLRALPKVVSVDTVLTSSLEAVYSDTDELSLAGAVIDTAERNLALDRVEIVQRVAAALPLEPGSARALRVEVRLDCEADAARERLGIAADDQVMVGLVHHCLRNE